MKLHKLIAKSNSDEIEPKINDFLNHLINTSIDIMNRKSNRIRMIDSVLLKFHLKDQDQVENYFKLLPVFRRKRDDYCFSKKKLYREQIIKVRL